MGRNSFKKHCMSSKAHLEFVKAAVEAAKSADAMNAHYGEIYSMGSTSLRTPALPGGEAQRARFRPILDEDTNGIGPEDFEMCNLDFTIPDVTDEDLMRANNEEILRREFEILALQHLDDEFEGGDDETIPNMTQEMRENGDWNRQF